MPCIFQCRAYWQMGTYRVLFQYRRWRFWQSATDATRHTVEFMSDGTFISDGFLYYGATAYTQTDSAVIEFLHAQNNTAVLDYVFELENNNSQLTISPLCIEGCSYRYKAISN